jgi:hypothetical protein
MIRHVVLLKIKDFAEGKSKQENMIFLRESLEALKEKLPQVFSMEVGFNFKPHEFASDVAIHALFKTKEDLAYYIDHPEHQVISNYVGKINNGRTFVDYEF